MGDVRGPIEESVKFFATQGDEIARHFGPAEWHLTATPSTTFIHIRTELPTVEAYSARAKLHAFWKNMTKHDFWIAVRTC